MNSSEPRVNDIIALKSALLLDIEDSVLKLLIRRTVFHCLHEKRNQNSATVLIRPGDMVEKLHLLSLSTKTGGGKGELYP